MSTGRLTQIPMWESARDEPPEYFSCRFPDLEMHLLQTCRLDIDQLPLKVLGLSGIAKWIGEVENGGIPQYFCNKITNYLGDTVYIERSFTDILDQLRLIGNRRYMNLFQETIELFLLEYEVHVQSNMTFELIRSERADELSDRIYARIDLQDFWKLYANYARSLPNLKFVEDEAFDTYVENLINASDFDRKPAVLEENPYLQDGRFLIHEYIADRAAYNYQSDLDKTLNVLRNLLPPRKPV